MDGLLLTLLLTGAISGAAVGFLAVTLLPGKQMISKWETMAIGVGAAWIGGLIASLFGLEEGRGIHWASLAIQVGLAMVGVWLWLDSVSYTHLTLPTTCNLCRSRWSPDH